MKKTTVTCDVCGRDDVRVEERVIRHPAFWRMGWAELERTERVDMCDGCAERASEMLAAGWAITFATMLSAGGDA